MKFDQSLAWNEHITDLKRSSAAKLIQISKLRGSMTKEVLGNLVSATVMSRVSYGDIVYDTASKNVTNKAPAIQNLAAKVITGVPKREHVTPLIHNLGWMRLNQFRIYPQMCLVYKCLHGLAPLYLSENFTLNRNVHQYQTRQSNDLHVPMTAACSNQRTFCFNGVKDFNALPSHVQKASSYGQFKLN
eukprot:gene6743-7503_t